MATGCAVDKGLSLLQLLKMLEVGDFYSDKHFQLFFSEEYRAEWYDQDVWSTNVGLGECPARALAWKFISSEAPQIHD